MWRIWKIPTSSPSTAPPSRSDPIQKTSLPNIREGGFCTVSVAFSCGNYEIENEKLKMKNEGIAFGDDFILYPLGHTTIFNFKF